MIIYWITWFYICFCNIFIASKNKFSKLFFVLTSIYLFVFVGFRYQVGGDWGNYLYFYNQAYGKTLTEVISLGDPAYNFLNFLGNYLEIPDTILVNAICGFLVLYYLTKSALQFRLFWLVFLIYFPYHLMVVSNGYTRQAVAIAISLWAFCRLFENKVLSFIIFILFASLFHKTAIILLVFLPIYIFFSNRKFKVWGDLYVFISFFVILALLYYFSSLEANIYLSGNEEMYSKGFFLRWSYHLIPLFVFYKYNYIFKQQRYYFLIRYYALLVLFILPTGVFFSTLADRFNLYLIFFDIFTLCISFSYFSEKIKQLFLFVLILFYSIQMFIWLFFGEWAIRSWIPYQNYITNYLSSSVF